MTAINDWRTLYPFQSHELLLDGHRYHYVDEGTGPVLLMVHGNPTWSFLFRDLIQALKQKYRVIAVDHIGCGLSDKPSPADYPYRLAQHIANVNRLIEELDLRQITLVGHDWGGGIGMGAAVEAPDRFARFVLMNTAAFRDTKCPWPIHICHMPVVGQVLIQGLNLFVRAANRTTVCHPERMTPAVRAGYLAPYDSWAHRTGVYRFVCDIPLRPSHPSYPTLVKIEQGLPIFRQHPVCFIWGMRDWCFSPRFLERFIEFYPQAEVHRLSDAGHYLLEDAHERVVPLIEQFVTNHPIPKVS